MIPAKAWAVAGIAAAAWAAFLLLVTALALRSRRAAPRRAGREGRLAQVRQRLQQGRGGLTILVVAWLRGNTIAVFVAALVIASLTVS